MWLVLRFTFANMSVCLSLRRPGSAHRGVKNTERLREAAEETEQRSQRDAQETPQKGTHADGMETYTENVGLVDTRRRKITCFYADRCGI